MTLNKLDEILTTRFIQLKAKFDGKITDVIITNDVAEEARIITNSVDPLYPIQTWKEGPSWFWKCNDDCDHATVARVNENLLDN